MGVFDRLADVVKSYLNSEDKRLFGKNNHKGDVRRSSDPDLDAAFEELNDYLNRDRSGARGFSEKRAGSSDPAADSGPGQSAAGVPESLRPDFAELGLPLGASAEECKSAYKKLLKIHHPDRHAGHPGNFKKATERTARINAAWDRIETWRETGAV
ncbi:MAG: J domain-containing protein [Treponema sp.]|nr:J domain-containing protein [Treponema sp.]